MPNDMLGAINRACANLPEGHQRLVLDVAHKLGSYGDATFEQREEVDFVLQLKRFLRHEQAWYKVPKTVAYLVPIVSSLIPACAGNRTIESSSAPFAFLLGRGFNDLDLDGGGSPTGPAVVNMFQHVNMVGKFPQIFGSVVLGELTSRAFTQDQLLTFLEGVPNLPPYVANRKLFFLTKSGSECYVVTVGPVGARPYINIEHLNTCPYELEPDEMNVFVTCSLQS